MIHGRSFITLLTFLTTSLTHASFFNQNTAWIRQENRRTNQFVRGADHAQQVFERIVSAPSSVPFSMVRSPRQQVVEYVPGSSLRNNEIRFFQEGEEHPKGTIVISELFDRGFPTILPRQAIMSSDFQHAVIAFSLQGNVSTFTLIEYSFSSRTFQTISTEVTSLSIFSSKPDQNEYTYFESSMNGVGKTIVRAFGQKQPIQVTSENPRSGDPWDRLSLHSPIDNQFYLVKEEQYPRGALATIENQQTVPLVLAGAQEDIKSIVKASDTFVFLKTWAGRFWLALYDSDYRLTREIRFPKSMSAHGLSVREGKVHFMVWTATDNALSVVLDLTQQVITIGRENPKTLSYQEFENYPLLANWRDQELSIHAHYTHAVSRDGAHVPYAMFELPSNSSRPKPTLIKAYGGFDINFLSFLTLPQLELDFIADGGRIVVAGLRGGSSKGARWYLDGFKEKRLNTAYDLVAVAQDIRDQGLATKEQIVTTGTSNGGLVVSLAAMLSPDSFGAVIPINGVLNFTMKDLWDSRYLGWSYEYLSSHSGDDPQLMASMDPITIGKQAIEADKKLPPMLVVSSLRDVRVSPLHSSSFVRELRSWAKERGKEELTSSLYFYGVKNIGHTPSYHQPIGKGIDARIWSFIYRITGSVPKPNP